MTLIQRTTSTGLYNRLTNTVGRVLIANANTGMTYKEVWAQLETFECGQHKGRYTEDQVKRCLIWQVENNGSLVIKREDIHRKRKYTYEPDRITKDRPSQSA